MKAILSAACLVLATIVPYDAGAAELKPLEAGTFVLGGQTVSVYYTASGGAYQVVTTVAPTEGSAGAPIRFVGVLLPGQKATVSAGQFGTTGEPEILELAHRGDLLVATRSGEMVVAK